MEEEECQIEEGNSLLLLWDGFELGRGRLAAICVHPLGKWLAISLAHFPTQIASSERALLSISTAGCGGAGGRISSACLSADHNSICNGGGKLAGGSAPSLLLDCPRPPMRANSAKHSVITIEDGTDQMRPMVRQISWRRRSSAYEQGLLCGGGLAAASTVPYVSRVIQEEDGKKKTNTKR